MTIKDEIIIFHNGARRIPVWVCICLGVCVRSPLWISCVIFAVLWFALIRILNAAVSLSASSSEGTCDHFDENINHKMHNSKLAALNEWGTMASITKGKMTE